MITLTLQSLAGQISHQIEFAFPGSASDETFTMAKVRETNKGWKVAIHAIIEAGEIERTSIGAVTLTVQSEAGSIPAQGQVPIPTNGN